MAALNEKKSNLHKLVLASIIYSISFLLFSQQTLKENKIEYVYNDSKTNQIPYFDNRFRLDAQLDQITMLFYHKAGATPVILIRPDGSKLRVNDFDKTKVEWFDDVTFDMIKIKRPMPGPWQVIGEVLKESQILVVSDVKIEVNPLPDVILAGETLKVVGKLINGNLAINNPKFRDVVQLDVEFISTNNAAYENFGAETVELTTFRDDGQELDEYASDGIFTGEFQLTIPAGEWIPLYRVKLPMVTRELRQQPIILHKTPITFKVDLAKNEGEFHRVHFIIDPKFVDPDSFIFQGTITYPDKQDEPFSLMEEKGNDRIKEFKYTEPGVHRINVSAFGKTINGREFRLVVPEYTFNVNVNEQEMLAQVSEMNKDVAAVTDESAVTEKILSEEELAQQQLAKHKIALEKAAKDEQTRWLIIGAGNLIIIVIGLGVFFILKKKRKSKKI